MLEVDGIIGRETVKALQGWLSELGYYDGLLDGVLDGVKTDGTCSRTVAALQSLLNAGVETVTFYAVPTGRG